MKNMLAGGAMLVLCALLLGGCATKHVPDWARAQPSEGVTQIHPDVMEKTGGTFTQFTAIMPPQFLVEVKYGVKGVWPVIASHMTDPDAEIEDGFCYAVESLAFGKNPWGFVPMQCVMMNTISHFDGYRVTLVNKDGGAWIASPVARGILDERDWDVKKFEKDFEYRKKILEKVGNTLTEIDDFWRAMSAHIGVESDGDVFEVIIGSEQWQTFRDNFIAEMGYELTMPDGSVVVSTISRDEMVNRLSRNPRITRWQRFVSRLSIPIGTPEVMVFGTATSVLNGGIAAAIDGEWQALVARGSGEHREHANQMLYLMQKFQESNAKNIQYKQFFAQQYGGER